MFGVWIVGVEFESNLARCFTLPSFMSVCHVHEVVFEGTVVVVFEATRRELACDDVDVRLGKTSLWMPTKLARNARGGLEPPYRVSRRCCNGLRTHFQDVQSVENDERVGKSFGCLTLRLEPNKRAEPASRPGPILF